MIEITEAPGAPDGPLGLSTDEVAEVEVFGVRWRLRTLTLAQWLTLSTELEAAVAAVQSDAAANLDRYRAAQRAVVAAGVRGWAGEDHEWLPAHWEQLENVADAHPLVELCIAVRKHNTSSAVLLAGFR